MILKLNNQEYFDTSKPIDISLSLHDGDDAVRAWYCDPIKLEPVITDRFIGDVNLGGAVNFRNLFMNPHANGTHTECVGHISKEFYSINQCLNEFHFKACVISVQPIEKKVNAETDLVITKSALEKACETFKNDVKNCEVLIIRSLPNTSEKLTKNYSNTNPTYFEKEAITYVNDLGVDHLMVDLPSIDREEDGGELIGHHVFWDYPANPQSHKTITELIFVPNSVKDNIYICNIQITSLENDASPSKILLFEIQS
ncbi:MAG: cyclase family protein [Crocinitomicaceae bacterium]